MFRVPSTVMQIGGLIHFGGVGDGPERDLGSAVGRRRSSDPASGRGCRLSVRPGRKPHGGRAERKLGTKRNPGVRSVGAIQPLTFLHHTDLSVLLQAQNEGGERFRPLAAGSDLVPLMKQGVLTPEAVRAEMERSGVRGMPIRDQMRLQLAFLQEALAAVREARER